MGVSISHCTVPGTVALTFDDGPYPYTSDLLDILRANNATATFFITAVNGAKGSIDDTSTPYPALLRRNARRGPPDCKPYVESPESISNYAPAANGSDDQKRDGFQECSEFLSDLHAAAI